MPELCWFEFTLYGHISGVCAIKKQKKKKRKTYNIHKYIYKSATITRATERRRESFLRQSQRRNLVGGKIKRFSKSVVGSIKLVRITSVQHQVIRTIHTQTHSHTHDLLKISFGTTHLPIGRAEEKKGRDNSI